MFGKKKKEITKNIKVKGNTYLAIDLGTEFIKCALFEIEENKVEILGYVREKQETNAMDAAVIVDIDKVSDILDKVIGKVIISAKKEFGEGLKIPRDAVVGISGELVLGAPIQVNLERDNWEREISDSEVDDSIEKIKKYTFQETRNELASEFLLDAELLEEVGININSVSIDNKRVLNPVGHTGKELSYKVFSTFAPTNHLNSIRNVLKKLNINLLDIIVEPYAIASTIEEFREDTFDAIIMDIGGGTTDIAVIRDGDLVGVRMYAIGGKVFTKRIEKAKGISYEKAEELKIRYSDSKLNETDTREIKRLLKDDLDAWITGMEIVLEEFPDLNELPTNIYLCGGGSLLPDIQEVLMEYPWFKMFNVKRIPRTNFLFPNKINKAVDKTRSVTLPSDVAPIALAANILNK